MIKTCRHFLFRYFFILTSLAFSINCFSQKTDSLKTNISAAKVDSAVKAEHSPRKAAIRSAILPGLGQIYNKKYWKVPIVYAALGITGYIFVDNLKTYRDLRLAYKGKYNAALPPPNNDSTDYFKIKPQYLPISIESLRAGRDQFRRYIDYSVLFFVAFWGLNVVDAVVDAHLKAFDISSDLSMKVKPSYNPLARKGSVSFAFNFH